MSTSLTPEQIKSYVIRWFGYQFDTDDIATVVAKIMAAIIDTDMCTDTD